MARRPLAAKWEQLRAIRRRITVPLEEARRANIIGASLQAAVTLKLAPDEAELLNAAEWAELAIVSDVRVGGGGRATIWRRSRPPRAGNATAAGAC